MKENDALRYATRYGGFAPDGMSYVITDPEPPRDWFNILTNPMYGAIVRVSGRGRSFYNTPDINLVSGENRAFYLRDNRTGEYGSPTGWPARRKLADFRCVHAPSGTSISSTYAGVHAKLHAIVPLDGDVELWRITLSNRTRRRRDLSWFSYFPVVLTNGRWPIVYYNTSTFDRPLRAVIARTDCVRSPRGQKYQAILAADPAPVAFDGCELAFLGATRTMAEPVTVEQGRLTNTAGRGEVLAAAVQHDIALPPGGTREIHLVLGVGNNRGDLAALARKYRGPKPFRRELRRLEQFWRKRLETPFLQTPDPALNLLSNVWIRRQFVMQILTERAGTGGRNARNSIQDALGYLPFDAAPARQRILDACGFQYTSGLVPMDWPRMPANDLEGRSTYLDGAIWLVVLLAAYVRETGDWKFLEEVVPYRDGTTRDTVVEHILAALRLLARERGERGLVLFRGGDWNDPLEAGPAGKGESTWTAMAVTWAIHEFAPLLRRGNRVAAADELTAVAADLGRAVNQHCWDGAWYLRGFTDLGRPFGVSTEKEGRIYLNAQTWAVISGIATPERAAAGMKSANRLCQTPYGPIMLAPPYTKLVPDIGRITQKVAGNSENGSIYNHAVLFKAYAECLLGEGDAALETLTQILPTTRQDPPEQTLHVPMWMTTCYEHAHEGHPPRATDLYYTGTVPWYYLVLVEGLLGVKAGFDGLEIRPCLPRKWKQCRIVRQYRGGEYHITIRNPHSLQTGRVRLVVDGEPVPGNTVPIKKGKCRVDVTL